MSQGFDLLLIGAGHAHLGVLRLWLSGQRPAGRIGLISEGPCSWYSGMLPGLLAGRYNAEQCRVALQPLCAALDIELFEGRVGALNAKSCCVSLEDGRRLDSRWLSLNVGSQPAVLSASDGTVEQLPVKPFARFLDGWSRWQTDPQPLAIVGGGAAGVELALALAVQVAGLSLLSSGLLLQGHPAALRRRALLHLARAGVQVQEGVAVDAIHGDALHAGGQIVWSGPRAILATGATALPWLHGSGLDLDSRGFVRIGATLQSLSQPKIFASGDCASLAQIPRSGVYAVRQGPVLAGNLAAALSGKHLTSYLPQKRALALLADGRGGALMSWAGLTAEGALLGWWKDRLDQGFIRAHQVR